MISVSFWRNNSIPYSWFKKKFSKVIWRKLLHIHAKIKMTKEEYYDALKSPQWIEKRNRIKKRDGYTCVKCKSKKELHVHHTYYLRDKMPWQVPDDCLITLCKICHKKEHENKPISSFYRNKPPKEKVKNKDKNKKPNRKYSNNLSKEDAELQKKYNEIKKKGKLPKSTYKPIKSNGNGRPPKRKKKKK